MSSTPTDSVEPALSSPSRRLPCINDVLAPELLQLILEHGAHSLSTAYQSSSTRYLRRNYLCSTSLVCSTWREIAQPLLWRLIWLHTQEEATKMLQSGAYGRYRTEGIGLTGGVFQGKKRVGPATAKRLLAGLHGVKELSLNNFSDVYLQYELDRGEGGSLDGDFFTIESLQGLTSLAFVRSDFTSVPPTLPIPLQTLLLNDSHYQTRPCLYTSFAIPSLTHLIVRGNVSRFSSTQRAEFVQFFRKVAPQLHTIELDDPMALELGPIFSTCVNLTTLDIPPGLGAVIIRSLSAPLQSLTVSIEQMFNHEPRELLQAILDNLGSAALAKLASFSVNAFGNEEELERLAEWVELKIRLKNQGCRVEILEST